MLQSQAGDQCAKDNQLGALVTRGKKGAYQPSRIGTTSYGSIDFRRETKTRVNSLQMDNQAALACIRKMGGTVNQKMDQLSKEL